MFGYTLQDFTRDVRDDLIDLNYPYIVIFSGTLQLGLFDAIKNYKACVELVVAITDINAYSHIVFSGLLPRPMDFAQSRKRCEQYNSSYRLVVEELRRKYAHNVGFVDPFLEFVSLSGSVLDQDKNFHDGIFLSKQGAWKLRSTWLRHLGYFPRKAMELAVAVV